MSQYNYKVDIFPHGGLCESYAWWNKFFAQAVARYPHIENRAAVSKILAEYNAVTNWNDRSPVIFKTEADKMLFVLRWL